MESAVGVPRIPGNVYALKCSATHASRLARVSPLIAIASGHHRQSYGQHPIELSHLLHPDGLKLRRIALCTAELIGRTAWLLYKGGEKVLVPQRIVEKMTLSHETTRNNVLPSVVCVEKE